jgi:hypothetical protein
VTVNGTFAKPQRWQLKDNQALSHIRAVACMSAGCWSLKVQSD